jgi:integrase
VLKYRRGASQRWLTIGRHGAPWTPESARVEAKKLLGQIAQKKDPAAERANERRAATFADFAQRYLEDVSRPLKKPTTAAQDELNFRLHVVPIIGRMKVQEVERADIARLVLAMKATPIAANRVRALLNHAFAKAEAWGLRPDGTNPTRHVSKFKEAARERFLSPKELEQLGEALADADARGESLYATAAVRLLVLTGARLGEILSLEWAHVDLDARLLRLPDSKTGAKTIALPAPAVEILAGLPRQQGNPHVICGARAGARIVNLHKFWNRIRKAAGLDDVRLHDLRHSFASVAAAGGMSLPLIGALLGHSQPATTARYAHLGADPRLAAADAVAATIAASMNGASAEIVTLRKR